MNYILYLIPNRSGKLIKIGKTRDSFKINRFKKIDEDFGARFKESYLVFSKSKAEIDNLEYILHKIFYKERRANIYKTGVGKTEWFKREIEDDVKRQINHLRKQENFKKLSKIKKGIDLKSKHRYVNWKMIFIIFIFFLTIMIGAELWLLPAVNKNFLNI